MPKKSATTSLADEQAAPGGAAAVDKAVTVLAAFRAGDRALSVTELAERTRLYKSTVLRLLASLAHGRLVQRTADGQWSLGPEVARLASIYSASFSLEDLVMPEMRALMERTQESVAFHVRQGDQRRVLYRVDSPQLLRDHVRAGEAAQGARGAGRRHRGGAAFQRRPGPRLGAAGTGTQRHSGSAGRRGGRRALVLHLRRIRRRVLLHHRAARPGRSGGGPGRRRDRIPNGGGGVEAQDSQDLPRRARYRAGGISVRLPVDRVSLAAFRHFSI